MERILLDFSPLKTGGGVQLALNFIQSLAVFSKRYEIFLLLPEVGPLRNAGSMVEYSHCFVSPAKLVNRLLFEYTELRQILNKYRIDKIYTFFGTGLPHNKSIKSFVGVAYPIICYPESPFWKNISAKSRTKQEIINIGRRERLKKASKIIVETEIMKYRLMRQLELNEDKFAIISPTVTAYVHEKKMNSFSDRYLCLSGLSPHKNLWRLYEVAKILSEEYSMRVTFVISCSREHYIEHLKESLIDNRIIENYFEFVGLIPSEKINDIYESADVMLNLSDLESFSNNYMEAWKVGLPIIASDRDFSRDICKKSAIYVDPHAPQEIAKAILKMQDSFLRNDLIGNGKELLSLLPTMDQRLALIMEILSL